MPGVSVVIHGPAVTSIPEDQPAPAPEAVPAPSVDPVLDEPKDEPQVKVITRTSKKVK